MCFLPAVKGEPQTPTEPTTRNEIMTLPTQTAGAPAKQLLTRGVNWNRVEDPFDLIAWNKLTGAYWLPEKVPVSNDLPSWSRLTDDERTLAMRVFSGLTLLDTIQGTVGAVSMIPDAQTLHEEQVLLLIAAQEAVHSKSYSYIFSSLASTEQIDEAFDWSENNHQLQRKAQIVLDYYRGDDADKRKVASVLLESFLFYSGFYLPFYFASRAKLTNTADVIRLILADEAVHGAYLGAKLQRSLESASDERKADVQQFAYDLLLDLYENEVLYTRDLYDAVGQTEAVKTYIRYNANKALMNMGYEALFPKEATQVDPAIMSSLGLGSETHDFFSGSGSAYVIATHEETTQEDWD